MLYRLGKGFAPLNKVIIYTMLSILSCHSITIIRYFIPQSTLCLSQSAFTAGDHLSRECTECFHQLHSCKVLACHTTEPLLLLLEALCHEVLCTSHRMPSPQVTISRENVQSTSIPCSHICNITASN